MAPEEKMSLPDMIENVKKSIVEVTSSGGVGSGVIVDNQGLIATNRHVVGADEKVKIKTATGQETEGRVIRADVNVDYALIKADLANVTPVPWNDEPVREGMTVVAIGHPLGYEFTVTKGIVSSARRVIQGVEYIQTDVPINPGNSGGPLLDEEGEVVGINTWVRGDAQNIGFAIPISYVQKAVAEVGPKLAELESRYYCPVCGFLNESKSKYCNNCGVRTEKPEPPAERKCSACGTVNAPQARFCKKCGRAFEKSG